MNPNDNDPSTPAEPLSAANPAAPELPPTDAAAPVEAVAPKPRRRRVTAATAEQTGAVPAATADVATADVAIAVAAHDAPAPLADPAVPTAAALDAAPAPTEAEGADEDGQRRRNRNRRRGRRGRNRTGQLFCMMAQSLVRSKDIALGGFYRRLAARRGGLVATKALARKLAAWFWRAMVKGDDYVEQGLAHYEAQVRKTKERALKRLAKELGREIVPLATIV